MLFSVHLCYSLLELFFRARPDDRVVYDLHGVWKAGDDNVGLSAPFIGRGVQAHRSTEVTEAPLLYEECSELTRGLI